MFEDFFNPAPIMAASDGWVQPPPVQPPTMAPGMPPAGVNPAIGAVAATNPELFAQIATAQGIPPPPTGGRPGADANIFDPTPSSGATPMNGTLPASPPTTGVAGGSSMDTGAAPPPIASSTSVGGTGAAPAGGSTLANSLKQITAGMQQPKAPTMPPAASATAPRVNPIKGGNVQALIQSMAAGNPQLLRLMQALGAR